MPEFCAPPVRKRLFDQFACLAIAMDQPAFGRDIGAVMLGSLAGAEQEDVGGSALAQRWRVHATAPRAPRGVVRLTRSAIAITAATFPSAAREIAVAPSRLSRSESLSTEEFGVAERQPPARNHADDALSGGGVEFGHIRERRPRLRTTATWQAPGDAARQLHLAARRSASASSTPATRNHGPNLRLPSVNVPSCRSPACRPAPSVRAFRRLDQQAGLGPAPDADHDPRKPERRTDTR